VTLTKNRLYALPDELGLAPRLQELYVDQNRLDCLPDTFTKLTHLVVFSAAMNRIVAIPNGISKLEHLRVGDVFPLGSGAARARSLIG
jgi:Leucine-rich repeat (LRR) protein